jgi:hypothetical protein
MHIPYIAYKNSDMVNQVVAVQLAKRYGAVVRGLHPKDPLPVGLYDAVLYNLDDVSMHRRCDVLSEILREPARCPRAAHGCDLSEDEVASLRMRGVAVAQRLQLDLFRILCRTVLQGLPSVPPDDALVEETWINLAR